MKTKNTLNEGKVNESRDFVIIDPRGNARPVGMKVQGAQYVKKMGGPAKGYHMVLAKNAMKARRAIEKNGGNATNSKIQNIMFDLMYETVTEANQYKDVSNKFKHALDVLPEKYFHRKGIIALIKKLKEKDPEAAMAYTMDAFGWIKNMKENTMKENTIKLKDLLNENSPGFEGRKFGDALPTLDSVKASYQSKNNINEAPMDKSFMKNWEKDCNVLITHLKSEIKKGGNDVKFFKNLLSTIVDAKVVPYNMSLKLGDA